MDFLHTNCIFYGDSFIPVCMDSLDFIKGEERDVFSRIPFFAIGTLSLIHISMEEMCTLNMGGTAVGTGINADEAYLRRIVPNLVEVSDMEFVQAYDLIDATQNLDPFVAEMCIRDRPGII